MIPLRTCGAAALYPAFPDGRVRLTTVAADLPRATMPGCRARWCCSTPTPTTRRSRRAGPWRGPPRKATGSCSCSRRVARWARSTTACSLRASRSRERRVEEVASAAAILGVAQVEYLGYHDSGMEGTSTNDAPGSFWSADVDEAAARLAAILRREDAEVLTVYDERGGYGHPDHVQVHRVGVRAAELAGTRGSTSPRWTAITSGSCMRTAASSPNPARCPTTSPIPTSSTSASTAT